jgi:hypothetical protein
MQIVKLLNNPVTINFTNYTPLGEYVAETAYILGQGVSYNGSSYVAIQETTGNLPTNTDYWQIVAERGDTGDNGLDGADGVDGLAATVTAGTTTTGEPGTDASVVNSGTESAAIFDFTIPRGDAGADGLITAIGDTATVNLTETSGTLTADLVNSYAPPLGEDDNYMTDDEKSKLAGIEAAADVTDATNVAAAGAVMETDYNANTILAATSDDTPVTLTVAEQTVVGRATGGNIAALAIDSDLSSVSENDDTIPSAKATKAMGDAKLALAGGTMTGDIQLGETDIKLDATLSGDEKWSGIVISGTAGAGLVAGEVCYLASSGKWLKVDGILDGTDTGFSKQLGICVLAANGDTDPTEMLIYGKVRSAKFPALTVGSPAYLSDTAGELVVAQPSTTNFAIRIVGYAITAEDLLFNPSNDYLVHV